MNISENSSPVLEKVNIVRISILFVVVLKYALYALLSTRKVIAPLKLDSKLSLAHLTKVELSLIMLDAATFTSLSRRELI